MSTTEAPVTCPYCARKTTPSKISPVSVSAYCHEKHTCVGSCAHCGAEWRFTKMGSFKPTVPPESSDLDIANCNLEYERRMGGAEALFKAMAKRLDELYARSQDAMYRNRNLEGRICTLEMENKKDKSRSDGIISRLKNARLSVIAEQLKNYREEFLDNEGEEDETE